MEVFLIGRLFLFFFKVPHTRTFIACVYIAVRILFHSCPSEITNILTLWKREREKITGACLFFFFCLRSAFLKNFSFTAPLGRAKIFLTPAPLSLHISRRACCRPDATAPVFPKYLRKYVVASDTPCKALFKSIKFTSHCPTIGKWISEARFGCYSEKMLLQSGPG